MDGTFVPNLSFGMKMIQSIRQSTDLEFDVHLMVQEPDRFIKRIIEIKQILLPYIMKLVLM